MLTQAMNSFQVASLEYREAKKAQYTDMTGVSGAKTYFRASELGSGDRKIIYSFFKHQLPMVPKTAKNLRQLQNGDYTHDRFQSAWEEMGALISMEDRLSSKDDEGGLAEYSWEWAGHYDGLLDMNILRAHALGKTTVNMVKKLDEAGVETNEWEMEVNIDDDFAREIGIFDAEGNLSESYEPITMVADIKTMNPFGFKSLKGGNLEKIVGYIDQLSFYMYMLNTPYGSIFVEDKGSQDLCEIQIVWTDLHEGQEYVFDADLHGEIEAGNGVHRVVINNARFFGNDKELGLVPRLDHLWKTKETLQKIEAGELDNSVADVMPSRCSQDPSNFPCSWGGGGEKCEFFNHCWDDNHGGNAIKPEEACPPDKIWEITYTFVDNTVGAVQIDSRKVPAGITKESFEALVKMGALDPSQFAIKEINEVEGEPEAEDTEIKIDGMFGAGGVLNLAPPEAPSETIEYTTKDGKRAMQCVKCHKESTYTRLGAGNTKQCPFCKHTNKIIKL